MFETLLVIIVAYLIFTLTKDIEMVDTILMLTLAYLVFMAIWY